MKLQKKTW